VVASDLEAFRRVLQDGRAGVLVPVRDAGALARELGALLHDAPRRQALAAAASQAVLAYDWSTVTRQVVEVYETVARVPLVHVDVDAELESLAGDLALDEVDDDAGRLVSTLRRWLSERPRLPDLPRLPERVRLPDRRSPDGGPRS
jgi:hypothetical protein